MNNFRFPAKPDFSLSTIYCSHRTSKAYLWGLVASKLQSLASSSSTPPFILDAACHALLTRNIFPSNSKYHGLDFSRTRLLGSHPLPGDVLYLADLSKPLPLRSCFDIVVSLNTLSHIPRESQSIVIHNLLETIVSGGTLFLNLTLSEHISSHMRDLSESFASVDVIYFDSYLSSIDESSNQLTKDNFPQKLIDNEFNVPNRAIYHRQVLLICNSFRSDSPRSMPIQPKSSNKILSLNHVADVVKRFFDDDLQLIEYISSHSFSTVFVTQSLLNNQGFQRILLSYPDIRSSLLPLGAPVDPRSLPKMQAVVLGLERGYTNVAIDRLYVNQLRISGFKCVSFFLARVRDGSSVSPSLIVGDG